MFSAILPELMSISVFVLSLLCILAGRSPGYLPNYTVLSMNVTGLKASYHTNTSEILPIHDFYNVHLLTHCQGNYHDGVNPPLVNVTCSPATSYSEFPLTFNPPFAPPEPANITAAKFLPATLIATGLHLASSNATLSSLSFPPEIQSAFTTTYNLQLHVSYIFYVLSLCWTGIAVLYGLLAFISGQLGTFTIIFTSSASTCLLISSAIVTAVQSQATETINLYGMGDGVGGGIGVMGGYGSGLLVLSWTAFGLSTLSSGMWVLAGMASAVLRSSEGV
jgi:hypothetical protein